MRRAVIDIGTNTVKLLVADVNGGQVEPVVSKDKTTRLGEGVNASRRLLPAAIERTVQTIADYAADAREHSVTTIHAFTTSATRDAENREVFLQAVRERCGIEVEVITGQREAELIFCGVGSDPAWARMPLLVLDIGGGSAEFIQGQRGRIDQWKSLPLGAVRLTEQFQGREFKDLAEFLRTTLYKELAGFDFAGRRLIATGGTNTTLVRVAKGKIDHAVLTLDDISGLITKLNAMTLAERQQVPGMPADRADIIVAGGAVLLFAMEILGAVELTVSTRNLRYGALVESSGE